MYKLVIIVAAKTTTLKVSGQGDIIVIIHCDNYNISLAASLIRSRTGR